MISNDKQMIVSRRFSTWREWLLVVLFLLFVGWLAAPPIQAKVQAYRGEVEIPTYPWWPALKHPYFQGTDQRNIYPYPMLDNLSRQKAPRTWRTVVLENDYLRVTFLPDRSAEQYS